MYLHACTHSLLTCAFLIERGYLCTSFVQWEMGQEVDIYPLNSLAEGKLQLTCATTTLFKSKTSTYQLPQLKCNYEKMRVVRGKKKLIIVLHKSISLLFTFALASFRNFCE